MTATLRIHREHRFETGSTELPDGNYESLEIIDGIAYRSSLPAEDVATQAMGEQTGAILEYARDLINGETEDEMQGVPMDRGCLVGVDCGVRVGELSYNSVLIDAIYHGFLRRGGIWEGVFDGTHTTCLVWERFWRAVDAVAIVITGGLSMIPDKAQIRLLHFTNITGYEDTVGVGKLDDVLGDAIALVNLYTPFESDCHCHE